MNAEQIAKDFWATRPRRLSTDRKIAGVAAALGRRYAIDPILVRITFIVLAIASGVGVLLYLLGWLLLPADDDETSAAEALLGRGRSSVGTPLTVLLGIALIPAGGAVVGGQVAGILWLAGSAAVLFLLHHSRARLGELPHRPPTSADTPRPGAWWPGPGAAPTRPASPVESPGPAESGDATGSGPAAEPPAGAPSPDPRPSGERTPPAWDPLGAAPFAWDLPEPGPPPAAAPEEPPQHRSTLTPITLGLALLAGGLAGALVGGIALAEAAAVALAVLGVGLLIGAVLHRGRGLIHFALPLALLTVVLHSAPAVDLRDVRVGEGRWDPTTIGQLEPQYSVTVGNGRLDLSELDIPDGRTARTNVAVPVGENRVIVGPDVDVELSCRVQAGAVNCLGKQQSGLFTDGVEVTDTGRDGPGGGRLVLDATVGIGNVHIVRALG